MTTLPGYKKLLSWLVPVTVCKTSSTFNPHLTLLLHQGQYILSTPFAVYSYGTRYRPFKRMFKLIEKDLPQVKDFLLLGTGLGSALQILQKNYNCYPTSTLIDIDEEVLAWSIAYMGLNTKKNVQHINESAETFLSSTQQSYDLVAIDVFRDLDIPTYFTTETCYVLCHQHLKTGGILLLNYIEHKGTNADEIKKMLEGIYAEVQIEVSSKNIFFVARK